jgi:hypothetical protein
VLSALFMIVRLTGTCCSGAGSIRQGAVEQTFAGAIQRNGMMRAFANIDANEDLDALMLFDISHAYSFALLTRPTTYGS